jgi:hypothetical protein
MTVEAFTDIRTGAHQLRRFCGCVATGGLDLRRNPRGTVDLVWVGDGDLNRAIDGDLKKLVMPSPRPLLNDGAFWLGRLSTAAGDFVVEGTANGQALYQILATHPPAPPIRLRRPGEVRNVVNRGAPALGLGPR